MYTRLVPVLVVVSLLAVPLGLPVGTAATTPPSAAAASAPLSSHGNATAMPPGVGTVTDAAPAPDGGTYLAGGSSIRAPNLTLTRLTADGSIAWQRQFGGPNDSRVGQAVVSTDDGVYVLALVGPADSDPSPRTPMSVRLLHLTPDGEVEWRQEFGNASRITPNSDLLADDGDGVVYARPTPGDPPGTRLLRVTADGSVDWNRTYAGGTPRTLAVGPDGDYLVAGQHRFDEAWLLRVGADGTVAVNRTYGRFHDRHVVGVVPTDDGGALLAGSAGVRNFGWSDPWVARVDADGVPVWSRTYGAERTNPQAAVATDAGVLLAHSTSPEFGDRGTRLTHVGSDGSVGTRSLHARGITTTLRVADDGTVRLYGYEFDRANRSVVGTVDTVTLPATARTPSGPGIGLTSNATAYRGQDLQFSGVAGVRYELYRLPGESESTEFDDRRLVRRLRPDENGTVSLETATLRSGTYAVRVGGGFWLGIDDGEGVSVGTNAAGVAFDLEDQRLRVARPVTDGDRRGPVVTRPGPNRTVVETFRGERGARVRIDADRESFTARVGLTGLNGSTPAPDALSAALAADPQFRGLTSDGTYGTVAMSGEDRNVTLDAGALPAGFYRLSVAPLDAADATRPATTRLIVVTEEREVALTPADESLVVPRGGSVTTNLTLAGADAGVGAIRIEANRTGAPPIRLGLQFTDALATGSASGGGGIGPDRSSAEVQSTEVRRSPNGTFTVARLSLRTDHVPDDDATTGTNALTLELGWIVDASGVPYSPADPVTVRYEVTDANATATDAGPEGAERGRDGTAGTGSTGQESAAGG